MRVIGRVVVVVVGIVACFYVVLAGVGLMAALVGEADPGRVPFQTASKAKPEEQSVTDAKGKAAAASTSVPAPAKEKRTGAAPAPQTQTAAASRAGGAAEPDQAGPSETADNDATATTAEAAAGETVGDAERKVTYVKASLRSGPASDADVITVLGEGTELRLIERRDEWVRVEETGSGRSGWVLDRQMTSPEAYEAAAVRPAERPRAAATASSRAPARRPPPRYVRIITPDGRIIAVPRDQIRRAPPPFGGPGRRYVVVPRPYGWW